MKRFSLLSEDGNDAASGGSSASGGGNEQITAKIALVKEGDNVKLKIINDSNYITNIQPTIYDIIEKFNNSSNSDPSTKKFFKKIEVKPVGQVDIAKLFNNLQTTINTINVYNSNSDVNRIKQAGKDQRSNIDYSEIDDKDNIKFKPTDEKDKEKTAEEKKTYEAQLANVKKVKDKLNSLKWAETGEIQTILNGGFGVIRGLMDDFQHLTKMCILSKNFWRNYNKNINLIANAIKYTNAAESKDASIKNIKDNIFNNSKQQYKMGNGEMTPVNQTNPIKQ